MVEGEATCPTRLTAYLRENARQVGDHYRSELSRRVPGGEVVQRSKVG
jgi:hypothetical protein